MSATNTPKSYGAAVQELKGIVENLRSQTEDIDVDELLEQVKQAKVLINICDGKLKHADAEIKKVLKDIQGDEEDEGEEEPQPPSFVPDKEDIPF